MFRDERLMHEKTGVPCPNCGYDSACGCKSCRKDRTKDEPIYEVVLDDEIGIVACGYCGFAMHYDMWCELNMDLVWRGADNQIPEPTPEERLRIINEYRQKGKMPFEKGYKPTFWQHYAFKINRKLSYWRYHWFYYWPRYVARPWLKNKFGK